MNNQLVAKQGDLVKTKTGVLGIAVKTFGNVLFFSETGRINSENIIEVRRPVSTLLFGIIDLATWNTASTIWRKEPENVTFLGVSYKANPAKVNKVRSLFKNVVEYDESASLSYNNEMLKQATNHVIVPPSDFSSDHIIGEGLYQQYLVRKNCSKTTEIYIEDRNITLPIKQVYKLQTSDMTKSALVIY